MQVGAFIAVVAGRGTVQTNLGGGTLNSTSYAHLALGNILIKNDNLGPHSNESIFTSNSGCLLALGAVDDSIFSTFQ